MTTMIQKWGNSQGVRIPKVILDSVNWSENEKIVIIVDNGKLVIKIVIIVDNGKLVIEKAKEEHKRKNIKELFKDYKEDYTPVEIDWGKPEGDEIW